MFTQHKLKEIMIVNENTIELTVALPLYNSREITWLAMESLVRQENIDFKWELLVAEEVASNPFGKEAIYSYEKKLREVGCIRIQYIPIETWIPLSTKWRMLGRFMSITSKVFVLQAADCYSFPRRLYETYWLALMENADWINSPNGLFYDINLDKTILYDQSTIEYPTGLNMALRASFARKLPYGEVARGVDSWLYRSCEALKDKELKVCWNGKESWKKGLDTNGLNNISMTRSYHFESPKPPFIETDMKVEDSIPKDIMERLRKAGEENKINVDKVRNAFA
jgi:hypothetical protein